MDLLRLEFVRDFEVIVAEDYLGDEEAENNNER